ncbi:MAG: 2Fe-2S iron-sulfur cluster-binding protein [Candidatus Sulfotelmatobacter sp.]
MSEAVDLGRRRFWEPGYDDCSCPVQWRRFRESTVRVHARDLPLVMERRSEDRAVGNDSSLDVPVRWSCRTGVCHTCMTGLIGGSIIYNPEPLERPAPGNVLVCCSQPDAGVSLDL